jgi:hypothetical protein
MRSDCTEMHEPATLVVRRRLERQYRPAVADGSQCEYLLIGYHPALTTSPNSPSLSLVILRASFARRTLRLMLAACPLSVVILNA